MALQQRFANDLILRWHDSVLRNQKCCVPTCLTAEMLHPDLGPHTGVYDSYSFIFIHILYVCWKTASIGWVQSPKSSKTCQTHCCTRHSCDLETLRRVSRSPFETRASTLCPGASYPKLLPFATKKTMENWKNHGKFQKFQMYVEFTGKHCCCFPSENRLGNEQLSR